MTDTMFLSVAYSCQTEVTLFILSESKSGRSIFPTIRCGLGEMTSAIRLTALRFSKNAALNRVLSNDLVKDLTLITLEAPLDGVLCKLKAADHLQGSPPGNCITPPRQENTR